MIPFSEIGEKERNITTHWTMLLCREQYKQFCESFEEYEHVLTDNTLAYNLRKCYDKFKSEKPDQRINFVTINFKKNVCTSAGEKLCFLIFSKAWVKASAFTHEQRGEDPESVGSGYHVHMLFWDHAHKPKSQIQREIYNTVKNYVGNKFHVDVREYPRSFLDDKLEYMKGKKWDSAKQSKVETDKLFREKFNLDLIYFKS